MYLPVFEKIESRPKSSRPTRPHYKMYGIIQTLSNDKREKDTILT